MNNRDEIPLEDIVPSLRKRYFNSKEYKVQNRKKSINSTHSLVYEAEKKGLNKMIFNFIGCLDKHIDLYDIYKKRNVNDWLSEWREMHKQLMKYVYRDSGHFRVNGHDVYFGYAGDEDEFGIPKGGSKVIQELYNYAHNIRFLLDSVDKNNIKDVCRFLAIIHFGFIRIHPFGDGNGRIARAITDQFAVSLGYPPVIAGYPRTVFEAKQQYHKAIRGCIGDRDCKSLSSWIESKIITAIDKIA